MVQVRQHHGEKLKAFNPLQFKMYHWSYGSHAWSDWDHTALVLDTNTPDRTVRL